MAGIFKTKKVLSEVGLTYDGICIGLSEEYFKENYPTEYLKGEIYRLIDNMKREEEEKQFNKCCEGIDNLCKKLELL